MKTDELHAYLFDGAPHALALEMMRWLSSSRRFVAFVSAAHSKIRKKLRSAQTPESIADVRLELETAYLLLQERALGVLYEPQVPGQPRRPDFAVTYTTHSTFMLEVTRLRGASVEAHDAPPELVGPHHPSPVKPERLADTACNKLGQLMPLRSNVLLIACPAPVVTPDALQGVMLGLKRRVEHRDATPGDWPLFRDRGDFFDHYRRLSEVIVCGLPRQAGDALSIWVNPQAKHPLTSKVRTALYRSQTAHGLPDGGS
jgi:hypothetical protein